MWGRGERLLPGPPRPGDAQRQGCWGQGRQWVPRSWQVLHSPLGSGTSKNTAELKLWQDRREEVAGASSLNRVEQGTEIKGGAWV